MKSIIPIIFLYIATLIPSQNIYPQNHIDSIPNVKISLPQSKNIYAIVICISDYLEYKDLNFEDRDAQFFYEYLVSDIGPAIEKENIILLKNKEATSDNISLELYSQDEKFKIGDELNIYFAGHGDYSDKLRSNPGFLVCYNAPKKGIFIGGTIKLNEIDDLTKRLVIDKKMRVLIILDMYKVLVLTFASSAK